MLPTRHGGAFWSDPGFRGCLSQRTQAHEGTPFLLSATAAQPGLHWSPRLGNLRRHCGPWAR